MMSAFHDMLYTCWCRFYATDDELKRLFKSINGLIFPVGDRHQCACERHPVVVDIRLSLSF